jgi:hypothetical protein
MDFQSPPPIPRFRMEGLAFGLPAAEGSRCRDREGRENGQNDAQVFTNNAGKLADVLARDVSHKSALEPQSGIAQPAQDIAKALHSELSLGAELGLAPVMNFIPLFTFG